MLLKDNQPTVDASGNDFHDAIHKLASFIGAKNALNEKGTDLAPLLKQGSAVLDRARQGHLEVVVYNNEKFVILSAKQVMALVNEAYPKPKKTMGELYPNLPFLPDSEDRPRYSPLADTVDHLRSCVKE